MLTRRHLLAGLAAGLAAASPARAAFHGSISGGSGAPTFDTTMTVQPSQRNWIDVTTPVLANVPTGNMVTATLYTASGSSDGFQLSPWQYPSQQPGVGNAYSYAVREIGKWTTIDTVSSPTGNGKAWVIFAYKNGANETGAVVQYVVGLNVSTALPTTWAMGAKTLQRTGGPLLSQLGTGSATAITTIKDKSNNVLSGSSAPFEVFYGRLVWKASGSPGATSYGTARTVDATTAAGQTPYSVTLDNGDVITINAIAGQWDVSPPAAAMVAALGATNGDTFTNTVYAQQFARNDNVILYDGQYNVGGNNKISILHSHIPTGLTTLNAPQPPTAGTFNVVDLEQSGWVTFTSLTPWGATLGDYGWSAVTPDLTSSGAGTGNNSGAGVFYFRFRGLKSRPTATGQGAGFLFSAATFTGSNSQARVGWLQVDHNYKDTTDLQTHTGNSGTAGFIDCGSSTSAGGRFRVYCHDNWDLGSTISISGFWEDSEIWGNRIEYASEDAIRYGMWDTTPGSRASKCGFNFILKKWWGLSSHPDYIQMTHTAPDSVPGLNTVYPLSGTPSNPATFTSTFSVVVVGNIGIPDSANNHATDIIINNEQGAGYEPTNNGTVYELDDGEGFLGVDVSAGRFYEYLHAGNIIVSVMSNGWYIQHPATTTRYAYNTMMFDYYAASIHNLTSGQGSPAMKARYAGGANSGTVVGSFGDASAGLGIQVNADGNGTPNAPSYTNSNNSTTYNSSTIAAVVTDPFHNWSTVTRLQEVEDALLTKGAEATRGASGNRAKVDRRNRTWDTSIFA